MYHGRILLFLFLSKNPQTRYSIIKETGIKKSTMTRALRSLEARHSVARELGPEGRFVYRLTLGGGVEIARMSPHLVDAERDWNLQKNLVSLLAEVAKNTDSYVRRVHGAKSEAFQQLFAMTIKKNAIEDAMRRAWGRAGDEEYLIWWKCRDMSWDRGERFFAFQNAPREYCHEERKT